jgi:hypothetical protein
MRRKESRVRCLAVYSSPSLRSYLWATAVHAEYPERQITVLNAFDPAALDLIHALRASGPRRSSASPLSMRTRLVEEEASRSDCWRLLSLTGTHQLARPMFRSSIRRSCRR